MFRCNNLEAWWILSALCAVDVVHSPHFIPERAGSPAVLDVMVGCSAIRQQKGPVEQYSVNKLLFVIFVEISWRQQYTLPAAVNNAQLRVTSGAVFGLETCPALHAHSTIDSRFAISRSARASL